MNAPLQERLSDRKSGKTKSVAILLVIVASHICFLKPAIAAPPEPEGRRLRAIVEEKYPWGNMIIGGTTG